MFVSTHNMKKQLYLVLITVITLCFNYSWAITNQELTIIYNAVVGDQTLTLNAELSNAYLRKDLEKSMYYAQETLKEALSNGSLIGVPFAHQQIGKVHLEKGELLEALEQFLIAQEKHKSTQNWKEIALNNILIGDVYANTGDVFRAENEFNKCHEIGKKIQDNTLIAAAFIALFDLEKNKQNLKSSNILKKSIYFIGQIPSNKAKAAFYLLSAIENRILTIMMRLFFSIKKASFYTN